MYSQENNYFYEIKEFDENYSENAIISRFLHAVGFRYYWSTEGLRENTLKLTKESIDIVSKYEEDDFQNSKIRFGKNGFDFYNLFHGPISDSLYHIGQIVSFRRSSGNPLPRGVNHFLGKKM